MERLTGRVAVVTGAASGIGLALAKLLAAEDMSVVMADVEEAALNEAAEKLQADGATVASVPTDVADAASVQALADTAVSRFGAVHVVCNNAGVSGTVGRTWVSAREDWQWVFEVNVWGVINGIRSFMPILLQQDEGHIVNTGSAACFEALPGMAAYGASKHAVLAISEALYRELTSASTPIGVSVLIPGGIVKSRIMSSDRNWLDRFGAPPERDNDPLPTMVRTLFTQGVDAGVDPSLIATAAIQAIRDNSFVVSDDKELLATWSAHHAALGRGEAPVWPPPTP